MTTSPRRRAGTPSPHPRRTPTLPELRDRPRHAAWLLAAALLTGLVGPGTSARADHTALGPVEPDAHEQEGLWHLNRARQRPDLYGQEIDLDLSGVAPRGPLALNLNLTGAARFHALEMLGHDYFAHTSAVTGIGPNQMAVDHGYDLFGDGLAMNWGAANNVESLAFGVNRLATFPGALELLIIDDGVPSLGHRVHLLGIAPSFADHLEAGFGRAASGDTRYYAIETGYRSLADRFVTGVVYRDADGDGMYDRGEGLPGVTVDVGGAQTTTLSEGGYAIAVAPGAYLVTCSGGALVGDALAVVDVVDRNVAVDCIEGLAVGEVDFAFQRGGDLPALDVGILPSASTGAAPLMVDFSATGGTADTVFLWDFGDGQGASGGATSHTFTQPGLYPVSLAAIDATGTGAALELIAVEGPGGAGPGTTPPADASLVPTKVQLRRNWKKPGKDSARVSATVELPAGLLAGPHAVEVSVAGAHLSFTLDEKGKGVDADGNKVKLKWKKAPGGAPLEAGVVGKLAVKLKGDLASALEAAGLRNQTGEGVLAGVPFGLLLNELAYVGEADLAFKTKQGKKGKAKLEK